MTPQAQVKRWWMLWTSLLPWVVVLQNERDNVLSDATLPHPVEIDFPRNVVPDP